MASSITKTPQARRDLLELADYIARDSLDAAERFLDAAEVAFRLLASAPEMGTLCEFRVPEAAGIRMWSIRGFESHVVFYRPLKVGVDVVRIIHAARDIRTVFGENQDDSPSSPSGAFPWNIRVAILVV